MPGEKKTPSPESLATFSHGQAERQHAVSGGALDHTAVRAGPVAYIDSLSRKKNGNLKIHPLFILLHVYILFHLDKVCAHKEIL